MGSLETDITAIDNSITDITDINAVQENWCLLEIGPRTLYPAKQYIFTVASMKKGWGES